MISIYCLLSRKHTNEKQANDEACVQFKPHPWWSHLMPF